MRMLSAKTAFSKPYFEVIQVLGTYLFSSLCEQCAAYRACAPVRRTSDRTTCRLSVPPWADEAYAGSRLGRPWWHAP